MTHTQWSRTIASKVHSSWNLHSQLPKELDFFILLSSLVGIHGFASQSNYAAGNTFQDSLAQMRTALGYKNSVALDLGWVHDIGMVTEVDHIRRHRENTRDMKQIRSVDLLALLDHFCDPSGNPYYLSRHNGSQVLVGVVTPADFRARGVQPFPWLARPLYNGFNFTANDQELLSGSAEAGATGQNYAQLFRQTDQEPDKRLIILTEALLHKLARTLGVDIEEMNPDKNLAAYGIDSLMAVELRNWLSRDFSATVTVFEIMDAGSIYNISDLIMKRSLINLK